ncbi:mucin-5AC-like [Anopheles aquasalis]|uniref:mucin-5AC-like n=1 Tax=Anopheles aquasalis TaxID=42839 RepID=UPI00215B1BD5|nr:mucin-5AC-like [Anopheles aquasalis]
MLLLRPRSSLFFVLVVQASLVLCQDIYADYTEDNGFDYGSSEANALDESVPAASTFWFNSDAQLSPPFIDTSLTQNCTNTSRIVCTGCRRVRICIPGISDPSMLPEQNCPPSTYCHSLPFNLGGACLPTADLQFPECRNSASNKASILCTGLGVFPDPTDCRRFHYCTVQGQNSKPFRCPRDYVYNSLKKTCSRSTTCRTITCRPNARSIFVPFPQNPAFYAYCSYNRFGFPPVLRNILMYKCESGAEFNPVANGCVFKCKREGFFAKPSDPTKYYWCRKVRGKLLGYEQVCPGQGTVFNPRLGICVPQLAPTSPATTTTTVMETTTPTPTTPLPTTPLSTDSSTTITTTTTTPAPTDSTTALLSSSTDAPSTTGLMADIPVSFPSWPRLPSLSISQLLNG